MARTCLSCGRENPDDSSYCNHCGVELTPKPPESADPGQRICTHCGAANPPYVSFCMNCSKDLVQTPASSAAARYCGWCGAAIPADARYCRRCGHDPAGPSTSHTEIEQPQRSSKPLIAGVLMIGAGVLEIVAGVRTLTTDVSSAASAAGIPSEFVSSIQGMLQFCGVLFLVFGVIVGIGGVFAFKRRHQMLALVAAVFGMLGVGPFSLGSLLSLIALVLLAISANDFED